MRTLGLKLLLAGAALLVCAEFASARLIESWPYERLFKEADLVVIAQATGSEECADRHENPWKVPFIGVNTAFKIEATLKGKCEAKELKVLHFRIDSNQVMPNGPLLVTFRTKPTTVDLKQAQMSLGTPDYMVFLKAREDGRYEPVSGRVDPLLSVREMHEPFSEHLEIPQGTPLRK